MIDDEILSQLPRSYQLFYKLIKEIKKDIFKDDEK